ncbi:LON peptidase substrate-binding domain-containing protein OS=Streptomyces cyaneofuscatus OX=66883 GN=G3I52_18130 PE=4 SV=1 [Streptomyces cyaneofuscatus]
MLPLNVFEERYRAMMRELLKTPEDEPRRFAVVAIRDGHEVAPSAPGMPDPTAGASNAGLAAGFSTDPLRAFHKVGCVADAATIRERADGTFEVLATGTTRVRLLSVDASGAVPDGRTGTAARGTRRRGGRPGGGGAAVLPPVPEAAGRGAASGPLATGADLPDEPGVVSYLVAAAMMLDTPTKQRLLQAPDTASRLRDELKLLRSETAIIRIRPLPALVNLTRGPTSSN